MKVQHGKIFLRTAHNYDIEEATWRTGLTCLDESRTKQSFKEECDINTIVKRFGLTGQLPENLRPPQYGDYSEIPDFKTAMNVIVDAQTNFMYMPAEIRARFHNSPQEFLEFCGDQKNLEEMREMGLAVPKPPPAGEPPIQKVQIVGEPPKEPSK